MHGEAGNARILEAESILQEAAAVRDHLLWCVRGVDDRVKLVQIGADIPGGLTRCLCPSRRAFAPFPPTRVFAPFTDTSLRSFPLIQTEYNASPWVASACGTC